MPLISGFHTVILGPKIIGIKETLEAIVNLGYRGVEIAQRTDLWGLEDKPDSYISDVIKLLKEDLVLLGLSGGTIEERIEFCHRYDLRPQYCYLQHWEGDFIERYLDRDTGIPLAIHPHAFSKIRNNDIIYSILEKDSRIKLVIDTAQLTIAEQSIGELIDATYDRIVSAHLKDWTPDRGFSPHHYVRGFTELGKGIVEPSSIVGKFRDIVQETKQTIWMVLEQDGIQADLSKSIRSNSWWLMEEGLLAKKRLEAKDTAVFSLSPGWRQCVDFEPSDAPAVFKMIRSIMYTRTKKIAEIYPIIVAELMKFIPARGIMVWSCSTTFEFLNLLCYEFRDGYELGEEQSTFDKCFDYISSLAIDKQMVNEVDLGDPVALSGKALQYPRVVDELDLARLITLPIYNPGNQNHPRILVDIYFDDFAYDVDLLELYWVGMDIAQAIDSAIDGLYTVASTHSSQQTVKTRVQSEFTKIFVEIVKEFVGCRSVSLFLRNETKTRLGLEATTQGELTWADWVKDYDKHYKRSETQHITVQSWLNKEPILATAPLEIAGDRKSFEVEGPHTLLIIPLVDSKNEVIGVVRCADKTDDHIVGKMFTEDDLAIIESISRPAISYIELLKQDNWRRDLSTRRDHEMDSATSALNEEFDRLKTNLDTRGIAHFEEHKDRYIENLEDQVALIEIITADTQFIYKDPKAVTLDRGEVNLYSDLIRPIARQIGFIAKKRGLSTNRNHVSILSGRLLNLPNFNIDSLRFRQVFYNLFTNAIKYAEEDRERFKVMVDGNKYRDQYLIWFRDKGIGIDEDYAEAIFEEGFRTAEAKALDATGHGFGLWLCKNIIELHGGSIELTSIANPTEFCITLPESLIYRP